MTELSKPTLYVVATPIGNLDDLSPRARRILEEVDLIAAEDTRHTGRLLSHFSISTPQIALHDHNEHKIVAGIIDRISNGTSVALVSDAGTPLVSDPGYRLVQQAHQHRIKVSPVPGPSAAIAALSAAGLPTDRFSFEGFLPAKRAARRALLSQLRKESRTMIFFESVHRIVESLEDLAQELGAERKAFIARELSKLHEQCVSATLAELRQQIADEQIATRGEFVLLVEGFRGDDSPVVEIDLDELIRALAGVLPGSQAADIVASLTDRGRNEIYRKMLSIRNGTQKN